MKRTAEESFMKSSPISTMIYLRMRSPKCPLFCFSLMASLLRGKSYDYSSPKMIIHSTRFTRAGVTENEWLF